MSDLKTIAAKWQKRWEEAKIFEANPDRRTKFFVSFPYPYVNGFLHVGHLYTMMRVEALARYKRMQQFNVLYPQGWHATGSPIINAAKRIAEKEPKQLKIMEEMGIEGKEVKKFADPNYWIQYFPPQNKNDLKNLGLSIDWRREFFTTSLNPHYDKFVRWQFSKLKEKNLIIKAKFPVAWCTKDNTIVQDHSRVEGEGETPKDFIWIKFKLVGSDLILIAGTTRPDALLGQTHLWVDPQATYKIIKVNNEKWVVGANAVQKVEDQYQKPQVIGEITARELMGKWAKGPLVSYPLYIVPAWFIDAAVGSGIVYSALEDPVDLIEIQDIQKDLKRVEKYGLDLNVIKRLKPISIIDVPGLGENLGQEMINKYKITSSKDKEKVKEAKDELNKTVYRKGVMKKNCGKYSGMPIESAQEAIKQDLIKADDAVMFYELTGRVVCRCLTPSIVKLVSDQWFIDYANPEWKKQAKKCLDDLTLYPEKVRPQFDYVINWLKAWACTHEEGLGTRLPWDEKWLIESLSDSTIYMAYYTIAHLIKEVPEEKIDDTFFDYIFLGKGKKPSVKNIDTMRAEFEYYYPVDFRNSGKDLIQNHLTFFMFNHVAIFPEKYWPKGIGANGWTMVDGQKMSKSLGNFITIRRAIETYSPDIARFTMLYGGESLDDPNWDTETAKSTTGKLLQLIEWSGQYGKGRKERLSIDDWMESKLHQIIKETTQAMELTLFRTALQSAFFDLQRHFRWYLRRCSDSPNKELMKKIIETQLLMIAPIVPHVAEEAWESMGKKDFISTANWPACDENKAKRTDSEDLIRQVMEDIGVVVKLTKITPTKIILLISPNWKYRLYKQVNELLATNRNQKDIIAAIMKSELKQYGQDIMKIIPRLVSLGTVPAATDQQTEVIQLQQAKDFLAKEFRCSIEVLPADGSVEQKAKQAMPSKPAIIVS